MLKCLFYQRSRAKTELRLIADFIAGMTGNFVLGEIERLRRQGMPLPEFEKNLLFP